MKSSTMLAALFAGRSMRDRSEVEDLQRRYDELVIKMEALEAENKKLRELVSDIRMREAATDIVREVYRGGA